MAQRNYLAKSCSAVTSSKAQGERGIGSQNLSGKVVKKVPHRETESSHKEQPKATQGEVKLKALRMPQ